MTAFEKYLDGLHGRQIAVIGAGVSNMPLIERLREAGLSVVVHDKKTEAELGAQYEALTKLGAALVLGEHYLDHLPEDVIFRTPGVHPEHPALREARKAGGLVTSEMELFFELCPCPVIGITGSDGKTTTTTLTCEILKRAGHTVHLGGNIGRPLLPDVEKITPNDLAVVELSSFQLMDMRRSPSCAAITNLTPNHLDYHGTFEEYVEAKTAIFRFQLPGGRLILNRDDPVTHSLALPEGAKVCWTSKTSTPLNGVFLRTDGMICISDAGNVRELLPQQEIRIPGAHNVYNIMMAAALVQGLAADADICSVAREFGGVEHRIEFVREKDGVCYYNDSIASSPTRTIAGLQSFDQKLILIAGGYDKHLDYTVLAEPICDHVKTLILTGATASKIRAAVEQTECQKPDILEAADLADAVQQAAHSAGTGDIVILSPASASFDCFRNFMERGDRFKALVHAL